MLFALAALVVSLASPADVTGKWDGTIKGVRPDGSEHSDTALLVLTQKDKAITGTVGGNETDQHPIVTGTIEGNTVTIVARHSTQDREYRLELTVDGDEMKGTLRSGERSAGLVATKRR